MMKLSYQKTLWLLSLLTVAFHVVGIASGGYGYFRDELYYIACANHPDIGYVDHPPLSIWILSAWKSVVGDSLFALRLLPGLCAGITTFVAGIVVRSMGGGTYALLLTGVSMMLAPIFLAFFGLFTMNAFDLLAWAIAFLLIVNVVESHEPRYWYMLGVIIGLGALNKISMLWLGAGIFIGILLTSHRRVLATPAPWIAAALSFLLFLPFVVWNITHDFAHLEFIRNASTQKYASQNPLTLFSGLFMMMNPLAAPIWLAGFWFFFARAEFRLLGLTVLTALLILLVNVHSKPEYFAAAMTALLPAGSVHIERLFQRLSWRFIRGTYAVVLAATGFFLVPLTMDILPVDSFMRYQSLLGMPAPSVEGHQLSDLPQHYADRFGWEHMTDVVGEVYDTLPDSEKQKCLIYGRNYGEAAAIDFFGQNRGLPPAISQHNTYWYWSASHLRQDATFIVIGVRPEDLRDSFEVIQEAGVIRSAHVMPYENDLPVTICRKPRRPVLELWREGRIFI